jgi:hypothetical protein
MWFAGLIRCRPDDVVFFYPQGLPWIWADCGSPENMHRGEGMRDANSQTNHKHLGAI